MDPEPIKPIPTTWELESTNQVLAPSHLDQLTVKHCATHLLKLRNFLRPQWQKNPQGRATYAHKPTPLRGRYLKPTPLKPYVLMMIIWSDPSMFHEYLFMS